LRIVEDDLSGAAVQALLRQHLDDMYAWTPPESVHALDLDQLRASEVTFYSAWLGEDLAGCGALRQIDPAHGEIKSMRTAPGFRRRGIGAAVLEHLLHVAAMRGHERVSLETGSEENYAPARRLYCAHGFVECAPFAEYQPDPLSTFMTLALRV
jgi:putative acetyltransferase